MGGRRKSAAVSRPAECVLRAQGLSRVYRSGEVETVALRSVDLEIFAGEYVTLLGPSGSGKSTLLNLLGGLDTASAGQIEFRNRLLTAANDEELTRYRREHVGFVFQFYNLIPSLTARENVELVTEIAARPLAASEALALVGLADRADHFPSQLSGGEQQRVAIARAIAKQPEVLFCDEPTGALDHATGRLVLQAIGRVNESLGAICVVITHNAAMAELGDRTLRMADGRIVAATHNTRRRLPDEISW
ncbi:MAG: ABC transporter ATP-binding protein [Leptospirales bacterium]|nr:ABC transporter ATP-binding protein [Leptospirales bacterium]